MVWNQVREKVFEFAFDEALKDATKRTAAATEKVILVENKEDYAQIKNLVKEYADAVLDVDNKNKPDFYDCEKNIEEYLKQKNYGKFTFGNIQKLINMTMKYLYIACYYDERLRNRFNDCHCPMDRTMKKKVVNMCKADDNAKNLLKYIKNDKETKNWSDVSWSTIVREDCNVYIAYQKMVEYLANKEGLSPLEFDFKEFSASNDKGTSDEYDKSDVAE